MSTCKIEGCESLVLCKELCNKHYLRQRIHGDPLFVKPKKIRQPNHCGKLGCPAVKRIRDQLKYLLRKEEIKLRVKDWGSRNRDKTRQYTKKYAALNPDVTKRKRAKYRKSHKGRVNHRNSLRHKKKTLATPGWLAENDILAMQILYELASFNKGNFHVDHIVPINGDNVCGLHVPENLQVIPGIANIKKSNKWNWDEQS